MIKIEYVRIAGFEPAIYGMRNPKNSWDMSDTAFHGEILDVDCDKDTMFRKFEIGENDGKLMRQLAEGGPVHAKYRRMMVVYMDVLAPLYWWKEFDTYKVGTVANSCSTMHKLADKEFKLEDFSFEHMTNDSGIVLQIVVDRLNECRETYLETKSKEDWWQMIQLLPSSYNQKRTVMLNYEVLSNIYKYRKDHQLDEWREFCKWIETLPLSDIITC